ncbi:phosphatase PAP2 family protein [Pseudoclavibacter sp. RFBA6]|uniref:phosphatase PAP2 family protein n=1 Tax=Pseudoclavibacter sp. RFBA6 TaxID=2080573 RepID=UPI000CE8B89D|nr:phosphatase PAP2 family protein [Pseudoclavibacter sp. RFBA6]PPG41488.1 phosphatidic acid phosphatase [Pseudoclavibacter sp. RFBA6]
MTHPRDSSQGVEGELAQDTAFDDRVARKADSRTAVAVRQSIQRVGDKVGPNSALILLLVIGAAIILGLSILAAEIYEAVTDRDGVAGLDQPLLDYAITLRSPQADSIITSYTDIAGQIGMPVIAVGTLLILSIRRRSWTPAILIVAAGGGSLLMTVAGKNFIGRVRPEQSEAVPPYETSASFPSGHTLNAVAVIGVIAYLLILRRQTRRARVLIALGAALFAITVGLSRVYLGHHWFTDVLAGWVLGAAWLALVICAHRLYLLIREQRHARQLEQTAQDRAI